jgi:hypothetical protein
LDVLSEIEDSNRGEQHSHSQLGVDSSSLTLHSHLESRSIDSDTHAYVTQNPCQRLHTLLPISP